MTKKTTLMICLLATVLLSKAQSNKAENLGLISELTFIKQTSENLAISIINDTLIKEEEKIKVINHYNNLKVISDQVILQLMTDCRRKNNLRYFKKLDKLLVKKTINEIGNSDLNSDKLNGYVKNLTKINEVYNKLININLAPKTNKSNIPFAEFTGAITLITTTIKDIRADNEKKVEKITSILNEVRISPIQNLNKVKTEEENKKD
jgi:hypothetical protein